MLMKEVAFQGLTQFHSSKAYSAEEQQIIANMDYQSATETEQDTVSLKEFNSLHVPGGRGWKTKRKKTKRL